MASSPMPELLPQSSPAPLPSPPAYSPLPPLQSEPRPIEVQTLNPIASDPPEVTSNQVGSAEWSELLTERRSRFHPLFPSVAAIVLLLAIALGALYFSGTDDAASNAIPNDAVTPSAEITDIGESETSADEVESIGSDSSKAPLDEPSLEELEGNEVSELMDNYQWAWLQAMNDRSMEPLLPYVTQPVGASEDHSVYNIVEAEIFGDLTPHGTRLGGLARYSPENNESIVYEMPAYILNESVKVSDDKYQLRISKRVRRDATVLVDRNEPELGTYPPLTTFKETSYTYNVVRDNGAWKVHSIEDGSAAPPVCYASESFTVKYERKDGIITAQNGNCPGLAPDER